MYGFLCISILQNKVKVPLVFKMNRIGVTSSRCSRSKLPKAATRQVMRVTKLNQPPARLAPAASTSCAMFRKDLYKAALTPCTC